MRGEEVVSSTGQRVKLSRPLDFLKGNGESYKFLSPKAITHRKDTVMKHATRAEVASLNGIQLGLAGLEAKFDDLGGPKTEPHVPVGWAWAANTPFQWTKQVASHFGGTCSGFDDDPWELYNVAEDFSQADNLAAKHPEKVKALQAAFLVEAKKYNVLPLDDRLSERFDASLRPNPLAGLKNFTYGPGMSGISESAVLNTHGGLQGALHVPGPHRASDRRSEVAHRTPVGAHLMTVRHPLRSLAPQYSAGGDGP